MRKVFSRLVVVLDTNVLAPVPVADTLLRLAEEPAFYLPRWPEEILLELESPSGITLSSKWIAD